MGRNRHREHPAETGPSPERRSISRDLSGLLEDLIRSAVLGMAFGSVLFVVADQTSLVDRVLFWFDLPAVGEYLDPKLLVIVGILLGVTLGILNRLLRRTRHFLAELLT
jgi:hypothetical protein